MKKLSDRTIAVLVGILIIVAYGVLVSEMTDSKTVILVADVVSGLAVIGIPLLLLPYFKPVSKSVSYFYLLTKLLEGGLMVYAGFAQLFPSLESHKEFIYEWPHLLTFIIGGFLFYYLLYISKLVPRFLSIWGFVAISVLLIQNLLGWFGFESSIIDMFLILIITNELVLAIWMIVKGLNINSSDMPSAKEVVE